MVAVAAAGELQRSRNELQKLEELEQRQEQLKRLERWSTGAQDQQGSRQHPAGELGQMHETKQGASSIAAEGGPALLSWSRSNGSCSTSSASDEQRR